ncbi:ATP-binding protein [Streptomyces sp. NPDC013187]|uniref:ATP-binding protein n=1 Tax=Streptomyces sp. NPDC013187 TaxID=3364865 RepID=UPI0036B00D2E
MRIVSLFPPELSGSLAEQIKEMLSEKLLEEAVRLVLAPSWPEIEGLAHGASHLAFLESESRFAERTSQVRAFAVSGYRDQEQGEQVLAQLQEVPIRLPVKVPLLHVHLDGGNPGAHDDRLGSAPDRRNSKSASLYQLVRPRAGLDDLILPEATKRRLLRNVTALRHRDILLDWGFGDIPGYENRLGSSLNFVGPSGTGKSLAARAVAHELGRPLLVVDYAQLESAYVGETSKNIKAVFDTATEQQAVLFFDEADSFLGARVQEVRQSYDTAVNSTRAVMLMRLQEFDGVVLFATNLPSNYDQAFYRRILDHVEFPLPDERSRARILALHTPARLPGKEFLDFTALAACSEGLSGGDLANVMYLASLRLLERISREDEQAVLAQTDVIEAVDDVRNGKSLMSEGRQPTGRLREITDQDLGPALGSPEGG